MLGVAAPSRFSAAAQVPQPPSVPKATREERISVLAGANRRRLDFDGARFSGPAWNWLVEQGRSAQFFLLGEEHGIAENPKLATQLFTALARSGYSRVAVEISPPMAAELDKALRAGGIEGLRRLFRDPGSNVAFFGMREEAEWLAAARKAVPGNAPFLWGNDYEVGGDRRLVALLKARRKPAGAATALATLEQASSASWKHYGETRNPEFMYSFKGDPALVRAVRAAWSGADAETLWILETLEETFEINRLWVAHQPWDSNARRAAFMRSNFLRHWRAEKKAGRTPKVFMKYGASHLMRGRSSPEVFDLGTLVPEIAALEGGRAFQLLVLPGAGTSVAQLDPTNFTYRSQKGEFDYTAGLEPITSQAWPDTFTLFDTHPLRPLLGYSRTPANPDLMRMVHGFDAILVMSGSTASSNL
jgi:hypothetical protein